MITASAGEIKGEFMLSRAGRKQRPAAVGYCRGRVRPGWRATALVFTGERKPGAKIFTAECKGKLPNRK
jgi:hypothetical protein